MKKIASWSEVSAEAREKQIPVVIMIDQQDCPFCRRVEREFFAAIFASREFEGQVIFGKISLDRGQSIEIETFESVSTRQFLKQYQADLTPTILFLDSDKNQLVEKMVGLMTPDYYLYYLEEAINEAIDLVSS